MWRPLTKKSTMRLTKITSRDHAKKLFFNPKEDYLGFLNKLRQEFDLKYNKNESSPETNLKDYKELTVLGAGTFGQVKLLKNISTKHCYAVKIMLKTAIVRLKRVDQILSEKRVLQAINFPTLVHLEFSFKDNDYIYIGMPVVSGGELYTYHRRVKRFNERQARFYAVQIALGFEYLHHLNVIYRDLKLENILIDTNGYIKLTDFSFAKKINGYTFTLCGTPEYLPPEVIRQMPYNTAADWWSFGIFVFELVAGRTPFYEKDMSTMEMYSKICDGIYDMPNHFSKALKDLIDSLLQVDVTKRLGCQLAGCKKIKNHPWFAGINWFSILNQQVNAPYIPDVAGIEDISNFKTELSTGGMRSKINRHSALFRAF